VVNAKTDKASVGTMAATIERHPERRFKAAFEAYLDQELPQLRKDHPGLRLQQYKDLLFKSFQKSPDNPFNQTTVSYDATKEEKVEALKKRQEEVQERLREKKGMGSS
ncbi:5858_t:CDS:2, partial [Acaulospora colombiana]